MEDSPSRWMAMVVAFGMILLSALVFGRSVSYEFVAWDDTKLVSENPVVQQLTPRTLWQAFTRYDPELYTPLATVGHQVDYLLGDGSPTVFHTTNLLLHTFNAFLVGWLLFALMRRRGVAGAVALLFLVHPLQVEAVAWVSARKDLLSATFLFLASIQYLRWREGRSHAYLWCLVFFVLACLSKVSAVSLPLMLLLLDGWQGRPISRETGRKLLPLILVAVLFLIIAWFGKQGVSAAGSLPETILLIPKGTLFLLWQILVPLQYAILYPYTSAITASSPDLLLHAGIVVALGTVAWFLRRRIPALGWSLLFFFGALLPNFMNFRRGEDFQDIYLPADRYGYIAIIGILFVLVLSADVLLRRLFAASDRLRLGLSLALTGVIVLFLSVKSFAQVAVWENTKTLFDHELALHPNSHVAHVIAASHFYEAGDPLRAIAEYNEAIRIRPTARAYINMGIVLIDMGKYELSRQVNRQALALDPKGSVAQLQIGVSYVKEGDFVRAAGAFRQTIALDPRATAAYVNLGIVEQKLGNIAAARAAFAKAIEIDPSMQIARDLLLKLPQ